MQANHFPTVTLLITHYNRSKSLEKLLSSFAELGITFGDIVVSDDCSNPEHLAYIEKLKPGYGFRIITTPANRGLGNNLNKGQDAVTTTFTLYVQEDFVPTAKFLPFFGKAVSFLIIKPELDIIRFYAYYAYPYLEPYNSDFSAMLYKPWFLNTTKIYQYTDHPHLRRSNFLDKFGRYKENIKSDKTEYLMCVSFIQHSGKGLFYNKFDELFMQENSTAEPSTVARENWKQSQNIFIVGVRNIYRICKYTYNIHFASKVAK